MCSWICGYCGQEVDNELDHMEADGCITALLERVSDLEERLSAINLANRWSSPDDLRIGKKAVVLVVMEAEYHPGYFVDGGAFVIEQSPLHSAAFRADQAVAWRGDDGFQRPVSFRALPLAKE